MRAAQPDTGHTFIGIGDGDLASQRAYGFYPVKGWFGDPGGINTNEGFYVPGKTEPLTDLYPPENEHAFSHSRSFTACPDAVDELQRAIEANIEAVRAGGQNAPRYDLTSLQCTTWARQRLSAIGFPDLGGFSPHGAAGSLEAEEETGVSPEQAKPR
jgi:hypothetical protein